MNDRNHARRLETETKSSSIVYDLFISYSRQDSAEVDHLATRLAQEAGLRVWFDRARLQPGHAWRDEIETSMNESAAVLIAWGSQGLGPVQRQERDLAYSVRDVRRKAGLDFLVIYVLLPNTPVPEGTWANVDTWIRFESSLDEPDVFATLVAALKGEAPPTQLVAELPDEPAPYRGMADFGVGDARFFFGRTAYVQEIQERLAHFPFLAVLGPSGSGKTSLVQAGFVARLQKNIFPGSGEWPCQLIRPGPRPLQSLAMALVHLFPPGDAPSAIDDLYERLRNAPRDLPMMVQSVLPEGGKLVLTLDRLEELFTLSRDEGELKAFLDAVVALLQQPDQPSWIVATMRADFYGHVARYAALANLVVNHQLLLEPMTEKEVAEVIEAPAAEAGAIFEKGLAMQVRLDAEAHGEVALPLLQHALDLLWRERRGRWLTWDAYQEIGGVAGALRYHADRVMEGLEPQERDVARRLFTRLIWLEEGSGAMMAGRRTEKRELLEQFSGLGMAERVLQKLADKRLIVLRGTEEQQTAELIHDTLPLHWDLLRQWVQDDQRFLLWGQRMREALAAYVQADRDEGALLRGRPLMEAQGWLARRADELNPDVKDFIQRGVALRNRKRLVRRVTLASFVASISILLLATFWQLVETEHQRQVARMGGLVAQAELLRNQDPDRLPQSTLLAVEAMKPEGGRSSSWLPRHALLPVRTLGRLRFGPIRFIEAQQTLRRNVTLLARPFGPALDKGWVTALAYSPEGMHLATAAGKTVHVWQLPSGAEIRRLAHDAPVRAVAYSPDGMHLAIASGKTVHIRLMTSGGEINQLHHDAPLRALAYSPDGNYLVAAAKSDVGVWDMRSGTQIANLPHESAINSVAFNPEGTRLATAAGNGVQVWDVKREEVVASLPPHEDAVNSLAFSPDGKYLATGSNDRTARIWDVRSGQEVLRVRHGSDKAISTILPGLEAIPVGDVRGVAFSPDGRYLATASSDRTARIWEILWRTNSGREVMRVVHEGVMNAVAFSPDGRYLATAGTEGSRVWETSIGGEIARMVHEHSVTSLNFSPGGKYLASATSGDSVVRLWMTDRSDAMVSHMTQPSPVRAMAFGPQAVFLTTVGQDNSVRTWEAAMNEVEIARRQYGEEAVAMAVSPDADYLALVRGESTLQVLRAETGEEIASLPAQDGRVTAATFSMNGRRLATVSGDFVQVWDTTDGKRIAHVLHQFGINDMAFSPDGRYLATAGNDFTARVWDTVNSREVAVLDKHEDPVVAVAFSPDGVHLATASGITAYVWEIRSKSEKARIPHQQGVNDVAFTPDGRYLASASTDGTARVSHWRPEDLVADACSRLTRNLTPDEWKRHLGDEPYGRICPDLP